MSAFIQSFSKCQPIGNPSAIIFIDTSTGSDPNIVERYIYLKKSDGTYLVPEGTTTQYILWPVASTTFEVNNVLDKDRALNITVQWASSASHTIFSNIFDNTFN